MSKTILWLDDIRDPNDGWAKRFSPIPFNEVTNIIWVKTYNEFVSYIEVNGLPDAICFDHDLSLEQVEAGILRTILPEDEKTGYDCAKCLVEYCLDNELQLPLWGIQSANTVGRENINGLLNNFYLKQNK